MPTYEPHRIFSGKLNDNTFNAEPGNPLHTFERNIEPGEVQEIEENDSEILVYLFSGEIVYLPKKKYSVSTVKYELRLK